MVGTLALPRRRRSHGPASWSATKGQVWTTTRARAPSVWPTSSATSPSPWTTTATGAPWATATQMMARLGELRTDPARASGHRVSRSRRAAERAPHRPRPPGRHRLLLRRHAGPRVGPRGRRPQGGRRLPLRPRHPATRGRRRHRGQGARADRSGRSASSRPSSGRPSRTEMRAGGVDWQLHLYGGVQHSFTNPHASETGLPGIAYHEASRPPVLAGHARPVRRGARLTHPGHLTPRQVPGYARSHGRAASHDHLGRRPRGRAAPRLAGPPPGQVRGRRTPRRARAHARARVPGWPAQDQARLRGRARSTGGTTRTSSGRCCAWTPPPAYPATR